MIETYIYNSTITVKEADKDQSDLLIEILNSEKQIKPHNPEKKQNKKDILKILWALFDGRERVLDAFESKIFPIKIEVTEFLYKVWDHSNLKILTPKQMLQKLLIAQSLLNLFG